MTTYFSDPTFLISLAVVQIVFYTAVLIATWRPMVTVLHLYLGTQILAVGVKPLFDVSQNRILHMGQSGWEGYGLGMVYQFLFNFLIVLTYLIARSYRRVKNKTIVNGVQYKEYLLAFAIGALAVAAIHFLSDGAWLTRLVSSESRNLTTAVPFGKYVFPLAAISLGVVLPMAFLLVQKPGRWPRKAFIFWIAVIASVFLVLLYQRGFLLVGVVVSLWLYERSRGLSFGKMLMGSAILLLLLSVARPLANGIVSYSTGGTLNVLGSLNNPLERFDTLDAWTLTVDAVQQHGFQLGQTLLAIPARFLPGQERRDYGLYTSSDLVNYSYLGEAYWDKGFGIAINFLQEQYVNFGIFAIYLGALIGFIIWLLDSWLYDARTIRGSEIVVASLLYLTGGFTGEMSAGIQWVLAYALFALGLRLKIRLLPKEGQLEASLPHNSR